MKSCIVLSFDDARYDNIKAFDTYLIPLKIPFTLNVTTGYVDGTLPESLWPASVPAMKLKDVIRFSDCSICEIALHGDKHIGTEEDVFVSYEKICSWTGKNEDSFGFASPGCNQVFINGLPNYISYERIGINKRNNTIPKRIARRISRMIPDTQLYWYSFSDSIICDANNRILYSATVFNETTVSQIERLIEASVNVGGSIILQFHSIGFDKNNADPWAWSFEKFEKFCQVISRLRDQNRIQILTTKDLVNCIYHKK